MFNLRVILRDWLNKPTPEEAARRKELMDMLENSRKSMEAMTKSWALPYNDSLPSPD